MNAMTSVANHVSNLQAAAETVAASIQGIVDDLSAKMNAAGIARLDLTKPVEYPDPCADHCEYASLVLDGDLHVRDEDRDDETSFTQLPAEVVLEILGALPAGFRVQ
jgi:hypothetical protein